MRALRFALAAGLLGAAVLADEVVYDSGGTSLTLKGVILKEDDREVVILTDFEEKVPIARASVKQIKKGPHAVAECLARHKKAAEDNTVDAWVELARFAKEKGLKLFEREGWERVLKLDAEHEEAHLGVGHVKVGGAWRTKGEAKAREIWSRKLEDLQGEFQGRPWAMVAPIKTEYCDVKCSSTKEVEEKYVAFLAKALFPVYDAAFPQSKFKWHHQENGKIFLFSNVVQFRDYMLVPPGMGGFFNPETNEVYTFHGSFGIRGTTLHVLAHECCHVYQWKITKEMSACPTWLLEGMATYFGDGAKFKFNFRDKASEFKASGITIEPPYDRVILLKRVLQSDHWYPLDKLLIHPHFAFGGEYYSYAWNTVYWCMDGEKYGAHKGEGRRLLDEYLLHVTELTTKGGFDNLKHLLAEAEEFKRLVTKHLGKSLSAFDEELKRFIRELRLDPIGTWDRANRRWRGLGLVLTAPVGFSIVDQKDMEAGEVAAFTLPARRYPRISVWAQSNDFLARVDEKLLPRWVDGLYEVEGEKTVRKIEGGTWTEGAVEAVFKGRRQAAVQQTMRKGQQQDEQRKEEAAKEAEAALVKVRFVGTATPDKVYFFACESPEKSFDADNEKFFEWFVMKKGVQLGYHN